MSNLDDILQRLSELTQFIEEVQDKLADGEVVNLSHLDQEVENLCQEAMSLPPDQIGQVQEPMAAMIGKLESLGAALQDFQKSLKDQHGV
ncbi:MAG: hypothetical protein AAF549_07005 [Pseudomonadota bacterium]